MADRSVCDLCGAVFEGFGSVYALSIHKGLNHPATQSQFEESVQKVAWNLTERDKAFLKCNKIDPEK